MTIVVTIVDPSGSRRSVVVKDGDYLGSDPTAAIYLRSPRITNRHGVLRLEERRLDLLDCQGGVSQSLPLVDGEPLMIEEHRLTFHGLVEKEPLLNQAQIRSLTIIAVVLIGLVAGVLLVNRLWIRTQPAIQRIEKQSQKLEFVGFSAVYESAAGGPIVVHLPRKEEIRPAPDSAYAAGAFPWERASRDAIGPKEISLAGRHPEPTDPFSTKSTISGRDWQHFPPRVGNGRLLIGKQLALGNYYRIDFQCRSDEAGIIAPEDLPVVGGKHLELGLHFFVEAWDGLPPNLGIDRLSFDLAAGDPGWESRKVSLVPRVIQVARPFSEVHSSNGWQTVIFPWNTQGTQFESRQMVSGESLIMASALSWSLFEPRVQDAREQLFAQVIPRPRKREGTPEQWRLEAGRWEREADDLLQGNPHQFSKEDWKRFPLGDYGRLLRAYRRYHEALILRQVSGDLPGSDDHSRIFHKATALYMFLQDPEGHFESTRRRIELMRGDRSRRAEALRAATDLYELLLPEQEPSQFPLDEWYLYAKHRKRTLQE